MMAITAQGTGSIEFQVTSLILIPSHLGTPVWTPDDPVPEPPVIPDQYSATLTPVADPEAISTVSGNITIVTEDISAFTLGDRYTLTLASA